VDVKLDASKVLSFSVGGFRLSTLLLGILALLGALPLAKHFLAFIIADPIMASAVAMLFAAILVYYLLYFETGSAVLKQHSVLFIVLLVGIIVASYMYLPVVKDIFSSDVNETVGQVVTLIVRR